MKRAPVVVGVVSVIAAIVIWSALSQGVDMPENSSRDSVEISGDASLSVGIDDPAWIKASSQKATRIEYRSLAPKSDSKIAGAAETCGPLAVEDKARLRQLLRKELEAAFSMLERDAAKAGSGPDGHETVQDALEQLESMLMAKRIEAKMHLLEEDRYVTTKLGEAKSLRWPQGFLTSVTRAGYKVDGVPVEVVFAVSPEHHHVAPVLAEVRLFQSLVLERDIEEFNSIDFSGRQERVEKSRSAVEKIRDIDSSMLPKDRQAFIATLMPDMLPGEWHVDLTTYFARIR